MNCLRSGFKRVTDHQFIKYTCMLTVMFVKGIFTLLIFSHSAFCNSINIQSDKIYIKYENQLNDQDQFAQTVPLPTFYSATPKLEETADTWTVTWDDTTSFTVAKQNDECNKYEFKTKSTNPLTVIFNSSQLHLYGGGVTGFQQWPIESLTLQNDTYVSGGDHGLLEAIWYTSNGFYVSVDKKVPLFVSIDQHKFTLTADRRDPYIRGDTTYLTYKVCKYPNVKIAYESAITDTIGKPSGTPDFRMIQYPVWSTWAQYKVNINESAVLQYANSIRKYEFPNSQLEIDDHWEICYGSLTQDTKKFPDLKRLVTQLQSQGFRVTIWIHPFINVNCEPYYTEALKKGYYVTGRDGTVGTSWWNGNASVIDFTNPEAASWWTERLRRLQTETGVDSFKFDAGESTYGPQPPILKQMLDDHPETALKAYIRTISEFGNMIEVRVGRSTQQNPILVRINDLDTSWEGRASLSRIIPILLNMNVIGYPFVLPDMVGGNLYGEQTITAELFVRWLQLNVFMPSIQFSIPPWKFGEEVMNIIKKYIQLHAEMAPTIYSLMNRATVTAAPLNAPLWWADPDDPVTYTIDSEFLLGDDILVAPVIHEGATSRDIYLPKGRWEDRSHPNKRDIIDGPVWLENYPANIEILPYFVKVQTPFRRAMGKLYILLILFFVGLILFQMRNYYVTRRYKDYFPVKNTHQQ